MKFALSSNFGAHISALVLASTLLFPAQVAAFIKGADVSWVPQMEAEGYYFYNTAGEKQDILTILKGYGVNACRLRTWVNPSSDPVNGHCNISETAALAVRCKNAGMDVNIDFHFGDTWNSVGTQNPPAAWASLSYANMLTAMSNYVYHSMNVLKANRVTPAWVQIGNEINAGICTPTGSVVHHPDQMTGLLNAAYVEVKAVFPSALVIIHLAQPQNLANIESWLDTYKSYGGKWDVTGFSSYGSGSAVPVIVSNMATIMSRYGKPVVQVEFGGKASSPGRTATDMKAYLQGLEGFGGLGLFYWEPECYSPFTSYAMGAWNSTTKEPTTILSAFSTV